MAQPNLFSNCIIIPTYPVALGVAGPEPQTARYHLPATPVRGVI